MISFRVAIKPVVNALRSKAPQILLALTVFLAVLYWPYQSTAEQRGVSVIKDRGGNTVNLYKESYALLIGVSDYTAGWPDLENIPSELQAVETALIRQGFTVIKYLNNDSSQLETAFKDFIEAYGFEPQNRLLIYYAGHGETRKEGRKGYLVPSDAPTPSQDERGFLQKALPMSQILAWARLIEAKHAIFLFDSCFAGTVFKSRALPKRPPHITKLTAEPVRQFITAGSAGETVPARSVFTPAFVDGLEHNLADLDKDGYVTGTELGLYLQAKVPLHADQTPQFGKIRDYELSQGDFVFTLENDTGKRNSAVTNEPVTPRDGLQVVPAAASINIATCESQDFAVKGAGEGPYRWWTDGQPQSAQGGRFRFLTEESGRYEVRVAVGSGGGAPSREWEVIVMPRPPSEEEVARWVEAYRKAREQKDLASLRELGYLSSDKEANSLGKRLERRDDYKVQVQGLEAQVEGNRVQLSLKRMDSWHNKRTYSTVVDYSNETLALVRRGCTKIVAMRE